MRTHETLEEIRTNFGATILSAEQSMDVITIMVGKGRLREVLAALKSSSKYGYAVLMDLTGVDYLEPKRQTKVVYFLHNPVNYSRIRVELLASRDESIPSVCDIWAGAAWYERELFDLFGVRFDGHVDLKRILMPDDWSGHPLRRDYALTEQPVQFKHGVKPKIPSEIIPHVKSHQRA